MTHRIPQEFLDDLIGRTDIVSLISSRLTLKRSGHEFTACCPFHAERTPSFTVSPVKQFYHCFGCGAHGNSIGFLMAYENLAFTDAVEDLAALAGLEVPFRQDREKEIEPQVYRALQAASQFFSRHLLNDPKTCARPQSYLKSRRINSKTARAFHLGYAPQGWTPLLDGLKAQGFSEDTLLEAGLIVRNKEGRLFDRFRDRIIFPIFDNRDRVVGFSGRIISEGDPKYLNSPETPVFRKGELLYGLNRALKANPRPERLLLVEGHMDVVMLAHQGIDYAVGSQGTALTTRQINALFRHTDEVVFCFDGDKAGKHASWRALETCLPAIRDGWQIRFLFLPVGEDPDSLVAKEGRAAFEARLDSAVTLADFFFQSLVSKLNLQTLEGRSRLVAKAQAHLEKLPDSAFRDLMVARLAETSTVDSAAIEKRLQKKPARLQNSPEPGLSPAERAMAMLLSNPELAHEMDLDRLRGADADEDLTMLVTLSTALLRQPGLTPAALAERWRGTPQEGRFMKLMEWRPLTDDQEQRQAFTSVLKTLYALVEKSALAHLAETFKNRAPSMLSDAEKEALRRRLAEVTSRRRREVAA